MTSALFRWVNKDGSYHDIDLDLLPRTSKPCNVIAPNLYIVPEGQPEVGRIHKIRFPNFRLDGERGATVPRRYRSRCTGRN